MRIRKLIGALAVVTAVAMVPAAGAQASTPGPLKHGEVKWILPPNNEFSLAYHDVRYGHDNTGGVEAMGYGTVENDDLTYNPTPRP